MHNRSAHALFSTSWKQNIDGVRLPIVITGSPTLDIIAVLDALDSWSCTLRHVKLLFEFFIPLSTSYVVDHGVAILFSHQAKRIEPKDGIGVGILIKIVPAIFTDGIALHPRNQ